MPLMCLCAVFAMTSCGETEEANEYANWKDRNEHYVDSVATLARSGTDGWSQIAAYTMGSNLGEDGNTNYYIYVKKLEQGDGDYQPQSGDSVRVHYLGRMIPTATYPKGPVFDKSYVTQTLNEATDVPTLMAVSGTVVGFATALMHMVEGDRWQVVIPQYLGYQGGSTGSIQPYSILIFDIKLARVYRNGDDNDTSWH